MKIAHISDLHLDKAYKKNNIKQTRRLIEYIASNNFDHVIISGDITENAMGSAFKLARNIFKKHGLLDSRKFSLVIGNHDIYGGVHLAEDVINYPAKCKATDYNKKVDDFGSFFKEAFADTIQPVKNNIFPFIKEFDEFVLIGLNSISKYSVFKNPFASNGKISDEQLEAVDKIFQGNDFAGKHKIIITHHHFCKDLIEENHDSGSVWQRIERQTMKLRNKKSIIKQFKKINAKLVLHGHLHESSSYIRKGIKFINAGGSILGSGELNINVININGSEIENEFVSVDSDYHPDEQKKKLTLIQSRPNEVTLPREICLN